MRDCNWALKCDHANLEWCTARTGRKVVENVSETAKGTVAEVCKNRRGYTDVQGAPRFPIKLPVALKSTSAAAAAGVAWSEVTGRTVETDDISPNGFLFRMAPHVPLDSALDFPNSLP